MSALDNDKDGVESDTSSSSSSSSVVAASDHQIWGYEERSTSSESRPAAGADVKLACDALALCMSPVVDQLAVATVDGALDIYNYSLQRCTVAARLSRRHNTPQSSSQTDHGRRRRRPINESTCSSLEYSGDGGWLFSGWSDGVVRVHDMHTGALKRRLAVQQACNTAAPAGVSCVLPLTERVLAAGDDDGGVSLWDYRSRDAVMQTKPCEDLVSDLVSDDCDPQRWLIASSSEGTVTSFCLRTKRVHTQCDMYDAPLCGLALMKNNRYLVAGMSSERGQLNIFKWPHIGQHASIFKGHPSAITALTAVTDSLLVVGYDDGSIRLCNVLPHRYVGVVGRHTGQLPVERLAVSHDGRVVASGAHDRRVRLWHVGYVQRASFSVYCRSLPECGDSLSDDDEAESGGPSVSRRPTERRERRSRGDSQRHLPSSRRTTAASFFSDLPRQDDGSSLWS